MVKTDKGYRRVVASPKPVTIVEHREIQRLIDMDFIVICAGGGGIPVVREGRRFSGVEAVIDKDLASSVLAREIKATFSSSQPTRRSSDAIIRLSEC